MNDPTRSRLAELRSFFDAAAPGWAERRFDLDRAREHLVRAGLARGQTVLDLGTGTGHFLPLIREIIGETGRLMGLDLSREMLRRCDASASRAARACASVEALPVRPACCDVALCIGLFPHFADRARALVEIHDAVRPGGRIVILHMLGRERLNETHRGIGGAIAGDLLPDEAEVRDSLEGAGFRPEGIADERDFYLAFAGRP